MAKDALSVAWDVSHLEFTIEDHYYFSILKKTLSEHGVQVKEIKSLEETHDYDVLVLNYPERPFTASDVDLVERYLDMGKKVIVCGYYANEDCVADNINTLARRFGVEMNGDSLTDEVNNDGGDSLLVVTGKVLKYGDGVHKLLMPCSASISLFSLHAEPIVLLENEVQGASGVMGAEVRVNKGRFVVLGSCVFWDNFAINRYDNKRFVLNLILS
ncbi:MAG: hypothetical protein QXX77_07445 [Candidatus Methanosuratincola sp.]